MTPPPAETAHDYGTGCKLTMLWIMRSILKDYMAATATPKLAREIDNRLVELIISHGGES